MKSKIFGGIMVMILAVTSVANAQYRKPSYITRDRYDQARIHQGVRSGELTRREARNLEMRKRQLDRDRRMAMADGRITPGERRYLNHKENQLSRAIYDKKHNYRDRY
ncbi:hypothetical protein MUY27_16475 [Mucilaginibacter sp. RS28]|uniref:Uncharacterized protein n=1 Tax=Mucilaginibacter straminoryzae TaxID=2932774 RepID=A0A9X1X5G0_9SPHI|nr:hypothetical protein [Mucilaginibacter straminoryzae]MCJ8211316.1 hypothetical protein [Mucilaginibacter straminoryzae]